MGDQIGQQLGNYRLLRLLGQGSFADVYLGEHIHLGTQAAIKVLQVRLGANSIQNFLNEARTIAHLVHPYIIRVLDFGVQGTIPFLVMDYAPRGTFRQRFLQGKPLPPAPLVSYMRQTAAALQYAHDRKFVHRDVKPENMLMGPNDEVLLSDFGFALIPQSSSSRTLTEETAGTAAYMAPEQLQGKPRPASDQYALGIISYEWLCGSRPFDGSFFEIASQQVLTPVPPMREKVPTIPREIEKVVMKALEKNPQERYPSDRDFALALEEACLAAKLYGFDLPGDTALTRQPTISNINLTAHDQRPPSTNQSSLKSNTFLPSNVSGRQPEQTQEAQAAIHKSPTSEKLKGAYENFMSSQISPSNEHQTASSSSLSFGPNNRLTRKTTLQRQSTHEEPFQEYLAQFPVDDPSFQPINNPTIQQNPASWQPPRSPSNIQPLSTLQPSQTEVTPLQPQKSRSGIPPFPQDHFTPSTTTTNVAPMSSEVQRIFNIQQPTRDFPASRLQSSYNKPLASDASDMRSGLQRLTDLLNAQKEPGVSDAQPGPTDRNAPRTLTTKNYTPSSSSSALTNTDRLQASRDTFIKINTRQKASAWTNKIILFVVLIIVISTSCLFFYLANTEKHPATIAPTTVTHTNVNPQVALTAQASATMTNAFNATIKNSKNPYAPNTGILDLNETLTNNNAHTWSENMDCQFAPDGYHVIANIGMSSTCLATNTIYTNFTYEVHMTFTKVATEFSSAGITFLGNHSTNQFYRLGIYASGRYNLELCAGDGNHCNSISNGKAAPPLAAYVIGKGGINQSNVLAIEVIDNTLNIYVNNQPAINPVQLSTNTTMTGMIGVFANGGIDGNTEAIFNNARIWAQ